VSFIVALVVAGCLTPLVAAFALRLGLIDRPSAAAVTVGARAIDLKIHNREVPLAGGFAVVTGALVAVTIVGGWDPWLAAAATLALAVGTVDDARSLPPWVRVLVLLLAGIALAAGGWEVEPLGVLGPAATVVVAVVCANGVNLIDGQDGLAAGVSAASALGLATCLVLMGEFAAAALPLACAGAVAGFAIWNVPPARVFLGNGGAYAIGVLLAASASVLTEVVSWTGLVAAACCLAVPAYEVAATIVRRRRAGASLTTGDRDHSYDVLAARWGSRSRATVALVVAAIAGSALGVFVVSLRAA
jgi:UDP-GlcNAc:undecaprenyl-phosphate GlcNAc-1-phosphate transferase